MLGNPLARLGQREREARRKLIKDNLNGPRLVTPASERSYLDTGRMLARTHAGFREPRNIKGEGSKPSGGARFAGNRGVILHGPIMGPGKTHASHVDSRRAAALRAAVRKLDKGD